jgi:uncharacterized damage-inducible protein DinB
MARKLRAQRAAERSRRGAVKGAGANSSALKAAGARGLARQIVVQAEHALLKHHLPRIEACVGMLTEEQVWWRANPQSNSVGNLLLHLAGNVRQWIISGLGGEPDRRQRDLEFSESGPLPHRKLLARLHQTVREACRVIRRLSEADLARAYQIQHFRVTGYQAVSHVTEHFAHHSGQVIFVTKLLTGRDLKFTRLPKGRAARTPARRFPAI